MNKNNNKVLKSKKPFFTINKKVVMFLGFVIVVGAVLGALYGTGVIGKKKGSGSSALSTGAVKNKGIAITSSDFKEETAKNKVKEIETKVEELNTQVSKYKEDQFFNTTFKDMKTLIGEIKILLLNFKNDKISENAHLKSLFIEQVQKELEEVGTFISEEKRKDCEEKSKKAKANSTSVKKFENNQELRDAVNSYLWQGTQTIIETYGHISNWDVSLITDMSGLFDKRTKFNEDITYWDTSKVKNMNDMFSYATNFDQDITCWDTSSVIDMQGMFSKATSFNQDISSWDTSQVKNMRSLFYEAESFNQDISSWDVSSVKDMSHMFCQASSFNNGSPVNTGNNPLNWNTSQVTNMTKMFENTKSFNQRLPWNTSQVTNMTKMFYDAESFNNGSPVNTGNNPLTWDTKNLNEVSHMFENAKSFNQPLPWKTIFENTRSMFNNATSFNQDISSWDTSNVTNMSDMFQDATSFNQNLSGWDVSNVNVQLFSPIFDGIFDGATSMIEKHKPKFEKN